VNDVQYYCGLRKVITAAGGAFQTYSGDQPARFTSKYSVAKEILPDGTATTFCNLGPLMQFKADSADVIIIVSYRPSFVFWRREKHQRFITMKSSDGILHWQPQPESN